MEKLAKDKYIIFLDVDGTLFDGKEVPEKTVDAFYRNRSFDIQ